MATKPKNVLLILRETDEDDFLRETWNALALLKESYIRHVYSKRQRNKTKNKRKAVIPVAKVAVTSPTNFSTEIPDVAAPVPPPTSTVVMPAPPKPTVQERQPTKVEEVKVRVPSPPKVIKPLKVDSPVPSQSFVLSISPTVVPEAKTMVTKRTSLLDLSVPPKSFKDAVTGTADVKKTITENPRSPQNTNTPTPPPKKATRKEKKLQEDPTHKKWIARREALENKGADLSCISVGRPKVKEWFQDMKITGRNLYVVWRGQKVGAFVGWEPTKHLVSGYKNAGYKKVYTEAEAVELLEENM